MLVTSYWIEEHVCRQQGCNEGAQFPGRWITAGMPKSSNVTSTYFNAVHLFPKDLRVEHGALNFFPLAPSNLVTPLVVRGQGVLGNRLVPTIFCGARLRFAGETAHLKAIPLHCFVLRQRHPHMHQMTQWSGWKRIRERLNQQEAITLCGCYSPARGG